MRALEQVPVPTGWPDVLVAPNRGQLLRAIHAAQRDGELGAIGPLLTGSHGMCYVRVVRLRMPRRKSRLVWLWLTCTGLAGLAGLVAAGWWLAPWLNRTLPLLAAVAGFRLAARWFR